MTTVIKANAVNLPEILTQIFSHLPQKDLARICLVNNTWFAAAIPQLWGTIYEFHGGSFLETLSLHSQYIRKLFWPSYSTIAFFDLGPNCQNLVKLHTPPLHPQNIDLVIQLLQQNPGLQHLSTKGAKRWEPLGRDQDLIGRIARLRNLKTLQMRDLHPVNGGMMYLLEHLADLVSLETNMWECQRDPVIPPPFPTSFARSLQERPLSLKKLKLEGIYLGMGSIGPILPILRASPNLESIDLVESGAIISIVDQSSIDNLAKVFQECCPRLQEMVLERQQMKQEQLEILLSGVPTMLGGPRFLPLKALKIEGAVLRDDEVMEVLIKGSAVLKDTLEVLEVTYLYPRWFLSASSTIAWILQSFSRLRRLRLSQAIVRIADLCTVFSASPTGLAIMYEDPTNTTSLDSTLDRSNWVPWACDETIESLDVRIAGPEDSWLPSNVRTYENDDYYVFPINHYGNKDESIFAPLRESHPIYANALRELNAKPNLNWDRVQFT
ncbi:hypothetical protein BGZ83_006387 [Gryganskiella cystojenkinii]|nr:hypothetical protein BGZ83_006387 [Gryganskiella cystojenkinii]